MISPLYDEATGHGNVRSWAASIGPKLRTGLSLCLRKRGERRGGIDGQTRHHRDQQEAPRGRAHLLHVLPGQRVLGLSLRAEVPREGREDHRH